MLTYVDACGARANRFDRKTKEECKCNTILRVEQQRLLARQCTGIQSEAL